MLILASSYYAVRASLILPEFKALLDYDGYDRMTSFGDLILGNPGWFLGLVVPAGILLQFFLAERAVSSVVDPMLRMISAMSGQ